jgi:hypothetical protein
MAAGDMVAFKAHLDFVDARAPHEQMTHFLRACAELHRGDAEAAADRFAEMAAVTESRRSVLDGPSPEEIEAFLRDLRDHCSGLPIAAQGLAYERALVAVGEAENALESLRLRAPLDTPDLPGVDTRALATALAEALGDPALAQRLASWPPGALSHFVNVSAV